MATWISPQAVVDKHAEIDENVYIGPFCVVGPRARIGRGTRLENSVTLMGRVTLGVDNEIGPGSVIGGAPQDLARCEGETQVVIGDRNRIREMVTINCASEKEEGITSIGDDNFLMATAHVGHDCRVGNHVILTNACLLGGHVHIRDRAILGGAAAVHQFCTIYEYAFIGGVSAVRRDIAPFQLTEGNTATPHGINHVGLKRNGFSSETIQRISKASRLLFRKKVGLEVARETLEAKGPLDEEVQYLFDCVERCQEGRFGRSRDTRGKTPQKPLEMQWRKAA